MKRRTIGARSAIGAAALPMAFIGCVPLKDLPSYSENAAPEQTASREPPPQDRIGIPVAPAQTNPTAVEENNPAGAPLEPAPTTFGDNAPAPADATPGDAAATPALPAIDAAGECAAIGGFTISETNSCYLVGDTTFSWRDARNFCQAWGGDLVQIDSAEENTQLAQRTEGSAWIGANDLGEEGTYRWVGGDPLQYMGWSMGQPNNLEGLEDCAELRIDEGLWGDVRCTDDVARRALCERSPSS
jgi:hypothetical protein